MIGGAQLYESIGPSCFAAHQRGRAIAEGASLYQSRIAKGNSTTGVTFRASARQRHCEVTRLSITIQRR